MVSAPGWEPGRALLRGRAHAAIGEFDVEALAGLDSPRSPQRAAVEGAHQGEAALQHAAIRERREQLSRPFGAQVAVVEQVLDREQGALAECIQPVTMARYPTRRVSR